VFSSTKPRKRERKRKLEENTTEDERGKETGRLSSLQESNKVSFKETYFWPYEV
jgi:hypothetical protein